MESEQAKNPLHSRTTERAVVKQWLQACHASGTATAG